VKRLLTATLVAFAALLALAGPASAHVTVTAPGAAPGGSDQEITFRVPVEENSATVGLTVQLPLRTPIASVLIAPMPGWTHTQKTTKLAQPIKTDDGAITSAVSQITWTAAKGGGLQPGEFGAFTIIAGQLPDASSLTFKALQTYSDGTVVKWIQVAARGAKDEPDFPAPTLDLTSAGTPAKSTSSSSNTGPVVLSIVALVVAAAALGLTIVRRAKS
jgi:uncharacterized protein YcnI